MLIREPIMNSRTRASKKKQEIKGTIDQYQQWRKDNCIGFDLWEVEHPKKGFKIVACQTKHGMTLVQLMEKEFTVFTHKASY